MPLNSGSANGGPPIDSRRPPGWLEKLCALLAPRLPESHCLRYTDVQQGVHINGHALP